MARLWNPPGGVLGIKVWHSPVAQLPQTNCASLFCTGTDNPTMGAHFREEPRLAKLKLHDQVLLNHGILMTQGKMLEF